MNRPTRKGTIESFILLACVIILCIVAIKPTEATPRYIVDNAELTGVPPMAGKIVLYMAKNLNTQNVYEQVILQQTVLFNNEGPAPAYIVRVSTQIQTAPTSDIPVILQVTDQGGTEIDKLRVWEVQKATYQGQRILEYSAPFGYAYLLPPGYLIRVVYTAPSPAATIWGFTEYGR